MAEVIGTVASAITLAGLFKLCIDAFDIIHTAQNQALDLKKLTLKLNIEKCRLYVWGQAMGLTMQSATGEHGPLDSCPYPELIHETLQLIISLFDDSQKLKEKYGCASAQSDDATATQAPQTSVFHQLNASFDNFKIKSNVRAKQATLSKKGYWVIRDRKKFGNLVNEAKSFVDGLQDITKDLQSLEYQQEMMSSRIRSINDARTLDWVSEVCEVNYPALSDAASLKADTITDISTFHDVQQWKETVNTLDRDDDSDASSVETTIAALEDLTVTELKHKFSTYLLRAREERLRKSSSTPLVDILPDDNDSLNKELATSSAKSFPNVKDSLELHHWNTPMGIIDDRRWGRIVETTAESSVKEPALTGVDLEASKTIMEGIAQARLDKDFEEEFDAIEKWFRVLSDAERNATFLNFSKILSPDQIRFFVRVQYQALTEISTDVKTADLGKHVEASGSNQEQSEKPATAYLLPTQGQVPSKWSPTSQKPDFEARIRNSFSEFAQAQKEGVAEKDAAQAAQKSQEIKELKDFFKNFSPLPVIVESEAGNSIITKAKSTESLQQPVSQSKATALRPRSALIPR